MAFTRIDIFNFRNISTAKFNPAPLGVNLLYGQNGSGKTSLLEALYYLSVGRSFRSSKTGRIIKHETEKLSIFAQLLNPSNSITSVGIERNQESDLKIRIDNNNANSIAELAVLMPILMINAYWHHFFDAGPQVRRKYLDWGVFYHSPDFYPLWRQYQRALKQRNAALRDRLPRREIDVWTREMIQHAIRLNEARRKYLAQLFPSVLEIATTLLPQYKLNVAYYSGWSEGADYAEILEQSLHRDLTLGYTQFGPHRADLKVTLNACPAKDILSRGQQKLFVCGMIIAQGALLKTVSETRPIYLIDDLPSELDELSRSKVMALISKQEAQVFITAVERNILNLAYPIAKVFHVEHGDVTEDQMWSYN